LARLTIQAKELKHPILQPLAMDFRDGLSPEEAAILAVLANPDLKAIRDERALAAAQLLDAGLLPDPVLALSKDVPVGGNDQGAITAHALQVSLDLTSLLTRGLRQRAAKASQQSVDLEVAWQEWQVAEMAKLSVYRLNALVPQVALAQEMILVLEENQHAIEKSAESGGTGLNELAAVRTALDAGSRNALFLKQALDRERQTLNALLGLQPHTDLILENPRAPRTWAALPSEAALVHGLDQRLDLVALEKGYESEDARLRLAVWSQFPSIGISLSRARDTSNVVTQGTGVALSLPLFNRGQGAVAVERATRQQLYDQYFARLQRARSDMAQIFSDLRIVRGMITAAERALPAIEAQAKNSEAAFREGQLDLLGRNQTRLTLLSQQTLLASLQSNLDELGIALEIASGHLLSSREGAR
jgi:outer membrane protein TolC